MSKILLVDDDPQALESTRKILEIEGHSVLTAMDGQEALELVRTLTLDLVISDVRMPRMGGMEFLKALSICARDLPVILMTAYGRVEDAVWAMKLGAVDFLPKPFKRQALMTAVKNAQKRAASPVAATTVEAPAGQVVIFSQKMREIFRLVEQIAQTQATALITGESGTGKEVIARAIHEKGPRAAKPFIAFNCAAIPEQLIESELFGHERGAFSGAVDSKMGLFEAAQGGTLFLDEIGDMPLQIQVKLLRALQEREFRRVGSTVTRKMNVRLIAATHQDLRALTEEGKFREDLLFRLDVVGIHVPPLRERPEDILKLAQFFIVENSKKHGRNLEGISLMAEKSLEEYLWPGNVRELANVIERAVVFLAPTETVIDLQHLPAHVLGKSALTTATDDPLISDQDRTVQIRLGTPLKDVEELLIQKTLELTKGDKKTTAQLLGINSRTIYRKLEKDKGEGAAPEEKN